MAVAIARPKLEGNIAVGDDRQLGFAEFGDPQGRAVFWLHGTPGARRQIPTEARDYAERRHIRLVGVPLSFVATGLIRLIRPVGSRAVDMYGRVSPEADRALLARPEFKAMFL